MWASDQAARRHLAATVRAWLFARWTITSSCSRRPHGASSTEEDRMCTFARFTERAKKVRTLAQEEAERGHHSYIGTEHLLLGLMRETDGLAAQVLESLGLNIETVRVRIQAVLGRNERIIIQQIIPTSRVKK